MIKVPIEWIVHTGTRDGPIPRKVVVSVLHAMATIGGLLLAVAFVVIQAARVATSGKPIGPTYADQSTARTATAIGWPIFVVLGVLVVWAILG